MVSQHNALYPTGTNAPKVKGVFIACILGCILLSSTLTHCRQCIECAYEKGGRRITSGKVCGKKAEVDATREKWLKMGIRDSAEVRCFDD
jgi:hypothetical protein